MLLHSFLWRVLELQDVAQISVKDHAFRSICTILRYTELHYEKKKKTAKRAARHRMIKCWKKMRKYEREAAKSETTISVNAINTFQSIQRYRALMTTYDLLKWLFFGLCPSSHFQCSTMFRPPALLPSPKTLYCTESEAMDKIKRKITS